MPKLFSVRSLAKQFTITLLACVCIAAIEMPAMAQQAPATAAPEAALQELIGTGSRIPDRVGNECTLRDSNGRARDLDN